MPSVTVVTFFKELFEVVLKIPHFADLHSELLDLFNWKTLARTSTQPSHHPSHLIVFLMETAFNTVGVCSWPDDHRLAKEKSCLLSLFHLCLLVSKV